MLEILIQGRGGQGAQTAGNLLARAFFAEGQHVQSFATYGGARRGTPVSSVIRVDAAPIRRRCDIEHADAVLCFDASLLDRQLLGRAAPGSVILVNTTRQAADFTAGGEFRIYTIDGVSVSQANGLGRLVNSALLGALACVLEAPDIETMRRIIADGAPLKKQENVNACMDGYRRMQAAA